MSAQTYEERMAAIVEKRDRERHQRLGAAIERGCSELPEGYSIHLLLELGSGSIKLYNPDGEEVDAEIDADDFGFQLDGTIDLAKGRTHG